MPRLQWDTAGEHYYESGIEKAVLFIKKDNSENYLPGIAWNGLISVDVQPTGGEATEIWEEDSKYDTLRDNEILSGTITAYQYPIEFCECDGSVLYDNGILIGQQSRKKFGFCYRVPIYDEQSNDPVGYAIHIIYNASVSPGKVEYETVNDTPDAARYEWEFTTTPVQNSRYEPVSEVIIDTRYIASSVLSVVEKQLYGVEGEVNPFNDNIISFFKSRETTMASSSVTEDGIGRFEADVEAVANHYEGMTIQLNNLEPGRSYIVSFNFKVVNGTFRDDGGMLAYQISEDGDLSYSSAVDWEDSISFKRNNHTQKAVWNIEFASSSTAYLIFRLDAIENGTIARIKVGSITVKDSSSSSTLVKIDDLLDLLFDGTIPETYTSLPNSAISLGARTYIPSSSNQVIDSGYYLSGDQTIAGDMNLQPINIRSGVTIFGVDGTYTSDADAESVNIIRGKTAYVNGQKVIGNMPTLEARSYYPTRNDYYITAGQYLAGAQKIVGDDNLVPENIRSGSSIFNISGNFTSDANAYSHDLIEGKTAYARGDRILGTIQKLAATTYTPTTGNQIIESGKYIEGDQTILGDVNLLSRNIRSGVAIFGVNGSYSGVDTSDADAISSDILSGKVAYVNGSKVTGNIRLKAAETFIPKAYSQTIAAGQYLNGSQVILGDANLISKNIRIGVSIFGVLGSYQGLKETADATATEDKLLTGYTAYVNSEKITGTIPIKGAETYTPGTTDLTISAGYYLYGNQTIRGDANLSSSNIREGVSIFGILGEFSGNTQTQFDTSDATAEADDLLSGKTAYVDGEKIVGTIPVKNYETYVPGILDQIISSGQYLSGNQVIKGEHNLIASNIKSGVSIFGIQGSYEVNKVSTSDATVTEDKLLAGYTAYGSDGKISGSIPIKIAEEYRVQEYDQVIAPGVYLYGAQTIKGIPSSEERYY